MEYPNNEKDMQVASDTSFADDCSKCESNASTETAMPKDISEMENKIHKKVFWRDFVVTALIGIALLCAPATFIAMFSVEGSGHIMLAIDLSVAVICAGGIVWTVYDKKIVRRGIKTGIITAVSLLMIYAFIFAILSGIIIPECNACGKTSAEVYYDGQLSWPFCDECSAERERCAGYLEGSVHESDTNYGACMKKDMIPAYEVKSGEIRNYCPACVPDKCEICASQLEDGKIYFDKDKFICDGCVSED